MGSMRLFSAGFIQGHSALTEHTPLSIHAPSSSHLQHEGSGWIDTFRACSQAAEHLAETKPGPCLKSPVCNPLLSAPAVPRKLPACLESHKNSSRFLPAGATRTPPAAVPPQQLPRGGAQRSQGGGGVLPWRWPRLPRMRKWSSGGPSVPLPASSVLVRSVCCCCFPRMVYIYRRARIRHKITPPPHGPFMFFVVAKSLITY